MARLQRYDAPSGARVTKLANGGIRVDAAVSRTGLQTYYRDDGSEFIEYRPPEEVFSPASLASFRGAPVTIGHVAFIDPGNYRDHTVGHGNDDFRKEGDKVVGSLTVMDSRALEGIEGKSLQDISLGYTVDLVETPGTTPEGGRYDAIQRNIIGNHIALLPPGTGRAGPEVRLRLDSALAIRPPSPVAKTITAPTGSNTSESPAGDSIAVKTDSVTLHVDGKEEIARLQGEIARLQGEIKAHKTRADAAESAERFDAAVEERVALVSEASGILGAEWSPKGLSADVIRRAVIAKASPETKLDGVDAGFVRGFYAGLVQSTTVAPSAGNVAARVAVVTATVVDSLDDEIEKARAVGRQKAANQHPSNRGYKAGGAL